MVTEQSFQHLSALSTCWSLVCRARQGRISAMRSAQRSLMERYGPAIRRYLRAAVRDEHAADDLYQEFALRFVRGDLAGADRERGRFRDFVKGVLSHLIADFYKQKKRDDHLRLRAAPQTATLLPSECTRGLEKEWRDQALHLAWSAFARLETEGSALLYAVLRCRAEHGDLGSSALAQLISSRFDRPIGATCVRQLLHRARKRFAELLVDEVASGLADPTHEELLAELEELRLLRWCRPAVDRRTETCQLRV